MAFGLHSSCALSPLSLCFNSHDCLSRLLAMVSAYAFLAVALLALNISIFWIRLVDSCPSTEPLYSLIDHHNSFTQRGTSCLLDFNLRLLDPRFNLSCLKFCARNICSAVRLIANCVRGSSPVMNVLSTANRSVGVKFCYENRVGLVARDWHRKHR